jgi:hypothetical protein
MKDEGRLEREVGGGRKKKGARRRGVWPLGRGDGALRAVIIGNRARSLAHPPSSLVPSVASEHDEGQGRRGEMGVLDGV